MLESVKVQPITAPQCDEKKRRNWLNKWLRLQTAHSKPLQELENEIHKFCADYAKNPHRGRRLVIYGNNGVGKSHSLRAMARWANQLAINLPCVAGEDGFKLTEATLLNWPATVNRFKQGDYWIADEAERADMLLIDDIGAEHDPSKSGCEKLYLLLERREFKWTAITTNATPETWEDRFERRISSRLIRNSTLVNVESVPDWNSL